MNTKTMKFSGVEYDDTGEIVVADENTAAVAIYIPLEKSQEWIPKVLRKNLFRTKLLSP